MTTSLSATSRDRLARLVTDRRAMPGRVLPWLPLACAAVYGLIVMARFPQIITGINLDSDAVIAPVLGKLIGSSPPGSLVVLGNHPWYEELWFLQATSGLSFYRQLWDVAPTLWSLLGLALLGWSASRAFGRAAAALVVAALVCLGVGGRFMFMTFNWHSVSAFHTILLGALLVWLLPRCGRLNVWQLAVVALIAGGASVAPVASDAVFVYWAIAPMLITAALVAARAPTRPHLRLLAVTVAIAAVALVGGALVAKAMRDSGVTSVPFPISFVIPTALGNHLLLLLQGYTFLGGGYFWGQPATVTGTLLLIAGLLVIAALVAALPALRRAIATADDDRGGARVVTTRSVYVAYWGASLLVTSTVFVLSSAPIDAYSARYTLAGYIAIGALLPLIAERSAGWRVSVVAGVCVFAAVASYETIRLQPLALTTFPTPREANMLVRLAKLENVSYGYASYWDAPDLTWLSRFRPTIYPVSQCPPPSHLLCPFSTVRISSWYNPRPGTRSMLIINPAQPQLLVTAPSPAFGRPIAATTLGRLQVFVYPFDIATRFAATPAP